MKRFLSLILLCLLSLLSSCAENSKGIAPITKNIVFDAEINDGGTETTVSAKVNNDGDFEFEIISPKKTNGMKFYISNGKTSLQYLGIEYIPNGDSDFNEMSLGRIYSVFKNISETGENAILKDDQYIIESNIGNNNYIVYFAETGLPLKISGDEFEAVFKNISIKQPD